VHGIHPARVELASDHAVPRAPARPGGVDGWLTTAKCATKLGRAFAGAPVWTLAHRVRLPDALVRLAAVARLQKPVIESAACFLTES
jgi:hypothetical protein